MIWFSQKDKEVWSSIRFLKSSSTSSLQVTPDDLVTGPGQCYLKKLNGAFWGLTEWYSFWTAQEACKTSCIYCTNGN